MNDILKNDIRAVADSAIDWDRFKDKTLLVTGATGFIGSFIIHAVLMASRKNGNNTKIAALVRNKTRAQTVFADYNEGSEIIYIEQDVCTPLSTDVKADFIIHCASNAAPKEYSSDPVGTMKTNFFGTLNLLEYAKAVGAERFLYTSTIEIYGALDGTDEIKETDYGTMDAVNVRNCYPISKKACENLCFSFSSQHGTDVCVGRLSYIFGPGMKAGDSKIVAVFPRQIANGENIVMKSKGEQLRSYTYISDAVSALLTILLNGENGQAYNIASSLCITTIAGIAHTLVDLYPEKGLKVIFDLPTEAEAKAFSTVRNAVLNSKKLEALGWSPAVSLKDGLKRVVEEQLLLKENDK